MDVSIFRLLVVSQLVVFLSTLVVVGVLEAVRADVPVFLGVILGQSFGLLAGLPIRPPAAHGKLPADPENPERPSPPARPAA